MLCCFSDGVVPPKQRRLVQAPTGSLKVGPPVPEAEGPTVRWRGGRRPVFYETPTPQDVRTILEKYGQEVVDVYLKNGHTICRVDHLDDHVRPGQYKEINIKIPVDKVGSNEIVEHVKGELENKILTKLPFQFKMYLSFGTILEESNEEGERNYRYFYPGNEKLNQNLVTVHDKSRLREANFISEQNFNEQVVGPRENSSTKFIMATNCHVKIFSMDRPLVGDNTEASVPYWLQRRRCIFYPKRGNNKLCVFDCIAYSEQEGKRTNKVCTRSQQLAKQFCDWQKENKVGNKCSFRELKENGLDILSRETLSQLETCFSINIDLYTLYSEQPYIHNGYEEWRPILCLEHSSCKRHGTGEKINLLAVEQHCLLIKDMSKLCPSYGCPYCKMTFSKKIKFHQHQERCDGGGTKYVYKAGYVDRPQTIFDTLEEYNIYIPESERQNAHRATFDIETREIEVGEDGRGEHRGEKTVIVGELKFISFSIASNVPGYKDAYFRMNETSDKALCHEMIEYLTKIKKKSASMWHEKMDFYYRMIQEHIIKLGGVPFIHSEQTLDLSQELLDRMELNKTLSPADADMLYSDRNFITEYTNIPPPQLAEPGDNDDDDDDDERNVLRMIRETIARVNSEHGESPRVPNEYQHHYSGSELGPYLYEETQVEYQPFDEANFNAELERQRIMGNDEGNERFNDEFMHDGDDLVDDDENDDDDGDDGQGKKKYITSPRQHHVKKLQNLQWKLRRYGNLPVCGFNSSKFDLLVLREFMPELFVDANTVSLSNSNPSNTLGGVIIKKGTSYTMFETKQGLVFLDVKNYVPPGLSLAKTLQVYNCKEVKGHFPYTLLGDSEFMSGTTMPDYVDYESTLKGINTLEDSWHTVVKRLYVHKWRPIVQSVIYGMLYSTGKQHKFADSKYMKVVLHTYQYEKGWMTQAELMESPTPIAKRQKYLCYKCGNMVKFLLPSCKLCMACYDPRLDTLSSQQESISLSKSRDDSYLQTYTWFLEQHTCCTGDVHSSPLCTDARLEWEETSHDERCHEKKSRVPAKFITGVENYHYIMKLWQSNHWTGKEYLKWYNNLDVVPLLEVVEKMCALEWEHNEIDCMKNNVSLPNLARIKVWKYAHNAGHYFSTFGPANCDQERKQRRCAYGGPSIVFNREQISGITQLNEGSGNPTESILGYDYNSLYPSTFLHNMPTGDCFVYKPDEQGVWTFRSNVQESRKQFVWLDTLNYQLEQMREHEKKLIIQSGQIPHTRYVLIRTERDGVPHVGSYKPDGLRLRQHFLDWELKKYPACVKGIVYEFYGCFWHGHTCQFKPGIDEAKAFMLSRRNADTMRRKENLEKMGYVVRYIYECEYDNMVRKGVYRLRDYEQKDMPPYVKTIITAPTKQKKLDLLKVFNDTEAVERLLMEGDSDRPSIYGFMEVDIEDVENRNKIFPLLFAPLEMDPRYIDPELPAPIHDTPEFEKKHQVLLTGVTKVMKGLYSTEYLRFLLEHGCKISKVYTVQEYTPKKCFKDLAEKLSAERAKGDQVGATDEQKILALNAKITANSIYGALLMNKDHHQHVSFVPNGFPVCRLVNMSTFKDAEYAGDKHTEITSQKIIIHQNVPIQISKTILDLAKMKISQFFWDVLDYFIDRDDYQIFQMDTDSLYFGLAKKTFEQCVKPHLMYEYERRKGSIFVQCLCDKQCQNPDCDKRKLNLMKLENYATHAVAITSKTHTEWVSDPLHVRSKTSAKGIPSNKLPNDTLSLFYMCMRRGQRFCCSVENLQAENTDKGGRVIRKVTEKTGVTGAYNHKRYLLPDKIRTVGLPFEVYAGTPKKKKGVYTDQYYTEREERVLRNVDKLNNLGALYN